jgi:hypothetical protein
MTDLRINSEIAKRQEWICEFDRSDMRGKVPSAEYTAYRTWKGFSFEKFVVAGSC